MNMCNRSGLICFMALAGLFQLRPLSAASLDGTAGASIYEAASYPFADTDFARGFVRLNAGFSVPVAANVFLNLLTPVAGAINLNGTGAITLEGDMSLASNATLSAGGKINGQGNAVLLQGNLSLSAGVTIECTSDTIIDGQGHELLLLNGAPGGQILINGPVGTTVTLRNMTLRGLKNYTGGLSGIQFGANANQKLVLENVKVHLSGPYTFDGGKLDIKGNTSIDGWHTFEFAAPYDCTIKKDSTFFIDLRTTFKYRPSDLSRIRIVMEDKTSRLFLNGCTLDVPLVNGLRLSKGHLIVDHRTTFFNDNAHCEAMGIAFGTGIPGQDLQIDIMPAAILDLESTFLAYDNKD